MKSVLAVIWVILFIVIMVGLYYYSTYNNLSKTNADIEKKWETLNLYLNDKAEILMKIKDFMVNANSDNNTQDFSFLDSAVKVLKSAKTKQEKIKAADELEKAASKLLSMVENYPQLKVNDKFTQMLTKLENIDNKIEKAKAEYNSLVKDFNKRLNKFPLNLIASKMGFKVKKLFSFKSATKEKQRRNLTLWEIEKCAKFS
ncbi:LemA family protein [Hippea alviniae]|uniref:LemA family protein n=1 Tax=Hippea alviniae TaxID=1279027 RepID=UPI0003B3BAE4|nr:LemA family protein [Hippea alviniae]